MIYHYFKIKNYNNSLIHSKQSIYCMVIADKYSKIKHNYFTLVSLLVYGKYKPKFFFIIINIKSLILCLNLQEFRNATNVGKIAGIQ